MKPLSRTPPQLHQKCINPLHIYPLQQRLWVAKMCVLSDLSIWCNALKCHKMASLSSCHFLNTFFSFPRLPKFPLARKKKQQKKEKCHLQHHNEDCLNSYTTKLVKSHNAGEFPTYGSNILDPLPTPHHHSLPLFSNNKEFDMGLLWCLRWLLL